MLLALSTNSPFWRGEATGLHSTRAMIFAAFPRSGISPRFESYQDYADAVGFMETTGRSVTTRTCGGTSARIRALARWSCA